MNARLAFGLAMLAALLAMAVFPGAFAPYPRGYSDTIREVEGPNGSEWLFAPERPSSVYPFGTDLYGYDIMTTLLWGLRWTLGVVTATAAARTLLGGMAGMALAMAKRKGAAPLHPPTRAGPSPLAGIPGFVIVFFILFPFNFNSPLGKLGLFAVQCAVMTIVDLGGIVGTIEAKTSARLCEPFVEAATASGADTRWILRYHVMPFLGEELLETFASQTVAVLQLVGRLGVFYLFVGGTVRTYDPNILTSATGEIAGLIGLYRWRIMGARWMLFWPLAAYLFVLAAFRLFASGITERERRKRRLLG